MIVEHLIDCTIPSESTVRDAIANLTDSGMLISLVVDQYNQLVGVVADGDIRRSLLAGASLSDPIDLVMNSSFASAPIGSSEEDLRKQCSLSGIRHIPLIDSAKRLVGLFVENGKQHREPIPNTVFILAGGKGIRLRPLTDEVPKPMIPIGKKPMLHHIIDGLREDGFVNFNISVNYLADQIIKYFGDGKQFGINVTYTRETEPLGTAGSLSLLTAVPDMPVVVINGDVFLSADVSEIVRFHVHNGAEITAGVKIVESEIPYGVIEVDGVSIVSLQEKPIRRDFVNAGVYVLEPSVVSGLSKNKKIDMTELIVAHISKGKVCAFPFHEEWVDLGRPEDLVQAQQKFLKE